MLDGPYEKVFATVVRTLNELGDPVVQADSDKGYIVTRPSVHTLVVATYSLQYLVAFERLPDSKVRMVFKVLQWDNVYENEDDVLPSGVILVTDSRFVGAKAGRFLMELQKRIQ